MKCEYRYPNSKDGTITKVLEQFWITGNDHVSFATKKEYEGRVTNSCSRQKKRCTLRITDLKESDSAVYKFRFITNLLLGSYTGEPGIQLSVTDLHLTVSVQRKDSLNSILTLKCSSSCVLPPKSTYVWYENGQKINHDKSTYSINSDSLDSISCAVKGHEDFPAPLIYAPVSPSLSADPSADIFEGSSVTLRCSSEANPPANYTWYKKTKTSTLQPLSRGSEFPLNNIQSSDSGEYYCEAENQLGKRRSTNLNVDVKYPPRLPSVSVNPPGEIVVGGSVNLTCSSDANPAATYAWYKENTASPAADGPMLTIVNIRHEDGGNYYCEARNSRGQHNSTLQLIVVTSSATSAIAGSITFLLLVGLFVVAFFIFRKKMA
ncbi:B-cell receptor CD22-like [Cyprinodon tularosa]|uniref:B-cell receptor CD22-like n=1 Tax=Cyprinodon tularosa TaxID=77115 RepID=UPI0018E237D2|nr:B-cell receptor CD22-like [Cyprinodon tularosa]